MGSLAERVMIVEVVEAHSYRLIIICCKVLRKKKCHQRWEVGGGSLFFAEARAETGPAASTSFEFARVIDDILVSLFTHYS
jgi:hypothetical protein